MKVIRYNPLGEKGQTPVGRGPQTRQGIKTVLMLEDDPTIGPLLKSLYEDFGVERVFLEQSGDRALELFQMEGDSIDLVSADRNVLGGLQGGDFVALVRRMSPLTPIMIVSATLPEREFPVESYMLKPVGCEQLETEFRRLGGILDERRAWSEDQIVEFVAENSAGNSAADKEIIRRSGWAGEDVGGYLSKFEEVGLKPILTLSPSVRAGTDKNGFCLVNLSRELGNPKDVLSVADFLARHEAMHVHLEAGRVTADDVDLPTFPMPQTSMIWLTSECGGRERKYAIETQTDSAALKYGGDKLVAQYCRSAEGELDGSRRFKSTNLPSLIHRQVVSAEAAKTAGSELGGRLEKVGEGFRQLVEDVISSDEITGGREQLRDWRDKLTAAYTRVFNTTSVDGRAVRNFERRIKSSSR